MTRPGLIGGPLRSALLASCLLLAACATKPPPVEGRVLQSGPPEAPLYETELETPGMCEFFLRNFSETAQASSRCVPTLMPLPYSYDMRFEAVGKVRVHASTLAGCERSRTNALAKDAMKVLSKCKKTAEPAKARDTRS